MPVRTHRHALVVGIDDYRHFPPLEGAVHDAELAAETLHRFGFAEPILLTDRAATRCALLAALDELASRAGEDDLVVVHYSGHGSRLRDRDGDEADGWDETLVPHDSGRGERKNRDVLDDELHRWLLGITRTTPFVTVVLDTCHSGTALRNVDDARVRRVVEDRRPPGEQSTAAGPETDRGPAGPSGWLCPAELGDRYTLLAACRDDESACERVDGEGTRHGALSWFLYRELLEGCTDLSYRELHRRVAPRVTADHGQHPQLEGARERAVFGTGELRPVRHFPLLDAADGRVRLGAGSALGLTVGSELAIYPAGTREAGEATPERARVRVTGVEPLSAAAEVIEQREEPRAGDRAVTEVRNLGDDRLAVELDPALVEHEPSLPDRIEASDLLRCVPDDTARVRVLRLPARREGGIAGDALLPWLGPLDGARWALLDPAGRLWPPVVREGCTDPAGTLVRHLERWSHHRLALELANPDAASRLRGAIDLRLHRRGPGGWEPLAPDADGRRLCQAGDRLGLEVENRSHRPLHATVLSFGLTGAITQLHPPPGARDALAPGGEPLRIAWRDPGAELRVGVPDGYPRPDPAWGAVHAEDYLKVFATTRWVDFTPLTRPPLRRRAVRETTHPLACVLSRARSTVAVRDLGFADDAADDDWTQVTRSFEVRVEPEES